MDELTMYGLLQRARQFADEGKWLHAVQVYTSIINEEPACDDAWIELASAYAALHKPDAAEVLLMERAAAAENPEPFLFILGSILYRAGRTTEAYRHFARVLRVEQRLDAKVRSRLHYFLGAIFGEQHKWSVAEYHFRTVVQVEPTFPRIHESLAEVLLRRGQIDEADGHLRLALAEEPYSWTGHYLRGLLESRRRRWEQALESFVQAVDIDPHEPRGWHKCGETLIAMRRLAESEHYLRKALELNPAMIDAVVEYGYLELERGDYVRAGEWFERALAADPGHRRALAGARTLSRTTRRRDG